MKRINKFEFKPVKVYKQGEEISHKKEKLEEENSITLPSHLAASAEETPVIKTAEMPDATEAHMRHENAQPAAVIVTSHCGIGSEYECIHKDNCPILDAIDDVILKFLDTNVVIGNEVKWCGHYQPRRPFSTGFIFREDQK